MVASRADVRRTWPGRGVRNGFFVRPQQLLWSPPRRSSSARHAPFHDGTCNSAASSSVVRVDEHRPRWPKQPQPRSTTRPTTSGRQCYPLCFIADAHAVAATRGCSNGRRTFASAHHAVRVQVRRQDQPGDRQGRHRVRAAAARAPPPPAHSPASLPRRASFAGTAGQTASSTSSARTSRRMPRPSSGCPTSGTWRRPSTTWNTGTCSRST